MINGVTATEIRYPKQDVFRLHHKQKASIKPGTNSLRGARGGIENARKNVWVKRDLEKEEKQSTMEGKGDGDMSIVGPRPLAVHHYERDLKQGNVTRALIKGGLIGLGHVLKGTPEMGQPIYEYEYIDQYLKSSSLGLLWLDLKIIWRGIKVIIKAKGL